MRPRSILATAAFVSCVLTVACDPAAQEEGEAVAAPREIVPGMVRPDARFEVAPEMGERFPDIAIVDAEGQPVRIRELAERKPYTVLTLGCLT